MKLDLPDGPADLGRRRVREGRRRQLPVRLQRRGRPGRPNVNAIVLEVPLAFLTEHAEEDRVVNVWGESWVRKAAAKIETIPDDPLWTENPVALLRRRRLDDELRRYKLVDTVGQPFADAGLSEREDNRQLGANNFWLAPVFVRRLAHLGWGFGPSVDALGLPASSTTTVRRSRCTRPTRPPPPPSRAAGS